jgi:hypothetical protein
MDEHAALLVASAPAEFAKAELGDLRLTKRLGRIVESLARCPDAGFPQAMPVNADLEAFYDFVRNDRVEFGALIEAHRRATLERIQSRGEVVVCHDTTQFKFTTERKDLGRLRSDGERAKRGFLAQVALAVSADEHREPLGVLGAWPWVRSYPPPKSARKAGMQYDPASETEYARWARGVQQVRACAPDPSRLIHVMDSEADDYALLSELVQTDSRFVIRQYQNRRIVPELSASGIHGKLKTFVQTVESVGSRVAKVSARRASNGNKNQPRHVSRDGRETVLSFSATPIVLRRSTSAVRGLPETIAVHVVRVWEEQVSEGVEPLEWLLLTTEPISTVEQICRVIDLYRTRWVIEEYFKAIKTGCAFEKRQLESFATLATALAIFIPIAWSLLRLRTLARSQPSAPAITVLNSVQLEVLHAASSYPLPPNPTVRDALLAVARLGGHIPRNGDPGWLVLGRGFDVLLKLERGYRLARCDQSLVPETDHS